MYIGDIYLPILSSIDKKSVSKITKEIAGINITDPKSVSIRRNLQPVTLDGYLYNDGEKNDAQYAEDVEALQYRSAGYCYTKYADLDGFIEIDNADAPQTSEELGVRNYSIEGKYLPATKYERVVEVETEMRENEFNIEFPPHVALPNGSTNVRVKTSQDSVKLSTPTFMAGDIPIYRPFPAFYPDDVTHSASDTPKYDKTAYKMSYNLLDAKDESISYTMISGVDVPLGSYRVVLRIKSDSTVNGDVKITVSDGTTNVVDSLHTLVGDGVWNIVKTASFSILQRGLTYTVTVSKATDSVSNIAVNYGFLLPEKRARVAFDVAAEYDVGECKVYDTVTTDAAEAGWIQVYNPEHDFAGDIIVQNSMFRWVIKQTAWKDATKVYNVTGTSPVEIGELYNKSFGDDSVAIKFKEIKPNYLKFTFELDTGNATSESTCAKEIDTVEITPFNVVIDKDVIGTYKDHYTFESTPGAMVEYENGIIAGIDSNSVYGLIKSVDVTSSIDGDIIETTGSESSDSYVVPFIIPCEITSYLYKQAADLVISKDNNDIERKFWKDDFSVDSSETWTLQTGSLTIGSGSLQVTGITKGDLYYTLTPLLAPQNARKISFVASIDSANVGDGSYRYICLYIGDTTVLDMFRINDDTGLYLNLYGASKTETYSDDFRIDLEMDNDGNAAVYFNGTLSLSKSGITLPTGDFTFKLRNSALGDTNAIFELKDISVAPSISYADDFTADTTERYQPVLGTVAYDDVNKRMNVTTATGANGKASGRLKSYKFTEGSQIYDVTLPTGADGDFICLVTHSANGLMTDGIGVGLQSDGAGNWNLATLSGTTVTEGADSGLDDADVARIEIEKDVTGAYWYYIYNAAGTKPTTPTGKLFTTLSEGYTGWYANGAGVETQTFEIDNISIRAESIVGRTNVELTEEVFNSVTGQMETRTYFKPIHRGAMLETYHDGTQEVVGTTFVDDCQWDRRAEWLNGDINVTHNAAAGCYDITTTAKSVYAKNKYSDGYIYCEFDYERGAGVVLYSRDNVTGYAGIGGLYGYMIKLSDDRVYLYRFDGTNIAAVAVISLTYTIPTVGDLIRMMVVKSGSQFKLYLSTNDPQLRYIGSGTDSTYTEGYIGFTTPVSYSLKIRHLAIIAAESTSTNGIAVCIPPIGGGARYGVEESVYNTFTTANVDKGVYLTSTKVKTTNPNADEVSLEYVNETTSTTLDNTSIVVDADYTIKTTPITIKENETDVLSVGVKNSTTCNQPATYVESLSLIPVSGNSVLYPQDLAFISGVKPSQKRKVEVK